MRILAIDYSTHAGYAVFDKPLDGPPVLLTHGTIHLKDHFEPSSQYPWNYRQTAIAQAMKMRELINTHTPDVVVIEETNGSKARYTQKLLEFLHYELLEQLCDAGYAYPNRVHYVNTNDWRSALGIFLTKEQKRQNAKLSKAKSACKVDGKVDLKLLANKKRSLGIKGKVTKKHAAVNYVNERFDLNLRVKDNDAAEAIAIGLAYIDGVKICDGTK